MLTLFLARNTVVWLPSSFNSSNAIAMLLLVAICVDRSLLVDTVRDYSVYNFDSKYFQTRVLIDENTNIVIMSDRSLARVHIQSRRHPGTIGSHAGIGIHPHIYNSDNPGTNTDIIRVDTSPHGVEIPTPPADFLIGNGSYVEPAAPREDIGSHPRSRGRFTSLKLPSTGEANRAFSGRHHPAR